MTLKLLDNTPRDVAHISRGMRATDYILLWEDGSWALVNGSMGNSFDYDMALMSVAKSELIARITAPTTEDVVRGIFAVEDET